jgi:hypothetical protein
MEGSRDFEALNLPEILMFLMSESFSLTEIRREARAAPGGSNMLTRDLARTMLGVICVKYMQCSERT